MTLPRLLRRRRSGALRAAQDFMAAGNKAQAHKEFCKAVDVDPIMCRRVMDMCDEVGVPYLVAPYEADAQLGYLACTGLVDVVLTEDSDTIPYGCSHVIFKLSGQGEAQQWLAPALPGLAARAGSAAAKDGARLREIQDLVPEELITWCAMSGCDYADSLPRMGCRTALDLLIKARMRARPADLDTTLSALQWEYKHGTVSPEYAASLRKAVLTFRHQHVFCPVRQACVTRTAVDEQLLIALDASGNAEAHAQLQAVLGSQGPSVPATACRGSAAAWPQCRAHLLQGAAAHPQLRGAELCELLSFIGAPVPDDVAQGIAVGRLHPDTGRPYPQPLPPHENMLRSVSVLAPSRSLSSCSAPTPTLDHMLRRPSSSPGLKRDSSASTGQPVSLRVPAPIKRPRLETIPPAGAALALRSSSSVASQFKSPRPSGSGSGATAVFSAPRIGRRAVSMGGTVSRFFTPPARGSSAPSAAAHVPGSPVVVSASDDGSEASPTRPSSVACSVCDVCEEPGGDLVQRALAW